MENQYVGAPIAVGRPPEALVRYVRSFFSDPKKPLEKLDNTVREHDQNAPLNQSPIEVITNPSGVKKKGNDFIERVEAGSTGGALGLGAQAGLGAHVGSLPAANIIEIPPMWNRDP